MLPVQHARKFSLYILCALTPNIQDIEDEQRRRAMEYGSLALFYDITDQEVEAMIQCFRMRRCRFHPGQIICTYGEIAGEVGVICPG